MALQQFQLGRSPLIFSVLGDHADNAEVLLLHGARPDVVDNIGRNALHWATFLGKKYTYYLICRNWILGTLGNLFRQEIYLLFEMYQELDPRYIGQQPF